MFGKKKVAVAVKPVAKKAIAAKPMAKVVAIADGKNLTPLEKARLARANGTAKPKAKKAPGIIFKPPADIKPCFIEMTLITDAAGMPGPRFAMQRVRGGWSLLDEDGKPKNKRFDMLEYDAKTCAAVLARFSALTYKTKAEKRLPANTRFKIVFRVAASEKNGKTLLAARIPAVFMGVVKNDKLKMVELTSKDDPVRNLIRRSAKNMAGAFVNIQLPPVGRTKKADSDEE